MGKLLFSNSKTLKLSNVLKYKVCLNHKENNFIAHIEQMKSYLRVNGTLQIGPLIQYTRPFVNEETELDMEIIMLLQCNKFIHAVDKPYKMESLVHIKNCLYCRYIGPEGQLKFAYDKLHLNAFENNISLSGESYTVYLEQNKEEETIIADVFMPRDDLDT